MKQVWREIRKVLMRSPAETERNSILRPAWGTYGRDGHKSSGVLEGGNGGSWRIYPDNRPLSHEECYKPVEREGYAVSYMAVRAREERDAHSTNIHIISPVTYRRLTGRDVRPSEEATAS